MPIGNYQFEISIQTGGLFKRAKEVVAVGDCIIGDKNLLRFMNRRIVVESITDEFKEEAGHILIRPCYIDQIQYCGMEDTSEGYCPVYSGILYTTGYHGERYEFSYDVHTNKKGIMVVCNDDFYVCPHCGYAESTMENMEVAGFNSHQKTLEKKHITPWGKNCEVKLVKNKLCHVFKTDVVRLAFSTPQAGNQEVMLSVMYALLEALSSVMDIERNDIKGCLHKIVYDNKLIYAIVLYDAVAGGAGHVRRLVTEDGRCFRQVVEKAIAITKGCNCSPSCYSCLRNYYNQKIHDLLNRKYAYDFLENYYGELEPITNEEFENGELYNV